MQPGGWILSVSTAAIIISCFTLLIEFNIWLKNRKTRKLHEKWDREDFEDQKRNKENEAPDRD